MRGWATLLNCGKSTGVLFSLAVLVWLLSPSARAVDTVARPFDDEICDSTADFFLGAENYSQAIRHHLALVQKIQTTPWLTTTWGSPMGWLVIMSGNSTIIKRRL